MVLSPKQGHVEFAELAQEDFMHKIGERLVICRFAARREDVSDEVIKKEKIEKRMAKER